MSSKDEISAVDPHTVFRAALERTKDQNDATRSQIKVIRKEIDEVIEIFNHDIMDFRIDEPLKLTIEHLVEPLPPAEHKFEMMLKCELTRRLRSAGWNVVGLNTSYTHRRRSRHTPYTLSSRCYSLEVAWPGFYDLEITDERDRALMM